MGRFINADEPIFIKQQNPIVHNIFAYCFNHPTDHADYNGFAIISLVAATAVAKAVAKAAVSIFLLISVLYALTVILNNQNFQKSVSSGYSKVGTSGKVSFEEIVIAIAVAYAIAINQTIQNKQEVHHIVARSAVRAAPARAILKNKNVNIGINSSTNTVAIKYNLHKRLHTKSYYDAVNNAIQNAYGSGSSGAKQRVINTLTAIKNILIQTSATLP